MAVKIELNVPGGRILSINKLFRSADRPNVLFFQTPILSVFNGESLPCYRPFYERGYNVFALDFSGITEDQGALGEMTLETLRGDIEAAIDHIQEVSDGEIHLFAGNGIGGIIAQYYLVREHRVASFAQYGVAVPGELPFSDHPGITRLIYPPAKLLHFLFPRLSIDFLRFADVEGYTGLNAERENRWYRRFIAEHPEYVKIPFSFLFLFLFLVADKKSPLWEGHSCPTLVFAPGRTDTSGSLTSLGILNS